MVNLVAKPSPSIVRESHGAVLNSTIRITLSIARQRHLAGTRANATQIRDAPD